MKIIRFPFLFLLILTGMYSCYPYKKIVLFQPSMQDTLNKPKDDSYRPLIQPNDILDIFVTSTSPEASQYFNYSKSADENSGMANGYLVDLRGEIQIPFIGSVKVAGLNSAFARDTISMKLSKYLVSPSVKLSIRNFKVTILGEVNHPGIYTVQNEKLTITEAIGLAGDFTIFGKKEVVMIIRDSLGFKSYSKVNMNNREVFASINYTLHANDIVYVEPNRKKRFEGENYYKVFPTILSAMAFILSVLQVTKK